MVISPASASWVPRGAWLTPTYAEWQPPAALRGAVACLWASVAPDDPGRDALVLPDGCSDLIWEQDVGGYVAGPDTGPVRIGTRAGTVVVGARFRPAAGGCPSRGARQAIRSASAPEPAVTAGTAPTGQPSSCPAWAPARGRRIGGRTPVTREENHG